MAPKVFGVDGVEHVQEKSRVKITPETFHREARPTALTLTTVGVCGAEQVHEKGGVNIAPETFIEQVAAVCGAEVADRMQAAFGGIEIYVPAEPMSEQRLCKVLGVEVVEKIALDIGYGKFTLPIGKYSVIRVARERRRAETLRLLKLGRSTNQIAQTLGVSSRLIDRDRQRFRELKLL